MRTLLDATVASLRTNPSLSQLHDSQASWVVATLRLRGWQVKLRARSAQLEDDLRDVTRRAQEWRLTADATTTAQWPHAIIEHIGKTSMALTEATDQLYAVRNRMLTLHYRIAAMQIAVDQVQEGLTRVAEQRRHDFLTFDTVPIWQARAGAAAGGQQPTVTSSVLTPYPDVVWYYLASVSTQLTVQGVGLGLLWAVLWRLRRQGERWRRDQDPAIQAVGLLVRHPFSSALLLTIFFGAALYKDAPEVVANLAWLLLLIPLLRLLPGLRLPELRLAFVAFAALYLLDRLLG